MNEFKYLGYIRLPVPTASATKSLSLLRPDRSGHVWVSVCVCDRRVSFTYDCASFSIEAPIRHVRHSSPLAEYPSSIWLCRCESEVELSEIKPYSIDRCISLKRPIDYRPLKKRRGTGNRGRGKWRQRAKLDPIMCTSPNKRSHPHCSPPETPEATWSTHKQTWRSRAL